MKTKTTHAEPAPDALDALDDAPTTRYRAPAPALDESEEDCYQCGGTGAIVHFPGGTRYRCADCAPAPVYLRNLPGAAL